MVGEDMSKFIPIDQCDNAELEEKKNGMPQLNLEDLIFKLDTTELMPQLKHHRYKESILHMLTYSHSNETKDENIDDILRFSSFTERKFMSVIYNEFHKNYLENKIDIASSDLELKLVDVEVLRKITRYFFYLQVSKLLGSEIPTIINEKKAKLQEEMNEKIEKIQKKISMNKARLEKCKTFCEYNSKKEFMKKGLNRVMTSKWKTAGHVGF
uniref:Uncharacterized protein n=1 Tax=Cannabis sativa TaxID=3483 RepID=A0A803Q9C3_CANSA